ncbi:MAG: hypothetical protein GXZ02_01235 [Clostridiales bacterium]|nr:hypothetical protein [Clostridiales bacterium]
MAEFTFEIVEHLGVIFEAPNGWKKELTRVSWNGRDPKYDIRDWSPEYDRMHKGITFTDEEIMTLKDLLNQMDQPDQAE